MPAGVNEIEFDTAGETAGEGGPLTGRTVDLSTRSRYWLYLCET
jgi:hypothetical protein